MPRIKTKTMDLKKIGEWLNSKGYGLDLTDDFWMEEILTETTFKDLAELLHQYKTENKD